MQADATFVLTSWFTAQAKFLQGHFDFDLHVLFYSCLLCTVVVVSKTFIYWLDIVVYLESELRKWSHRYNHGGTW